MTYQVQSSDTSYEAEQVQLAILRKRGAAGRGDLMRSLTNTTRRLSWNSLVQRRSDLSRQECAYFFIGLNYGEELGQEVRVYPKPPINSLILEEKLLSGEQEIVAALTPVVEVFQDLAIEYSIGGSLASSVHGIPRATADADLVADLHEKHVEPLIARLQDNYYISETAIREALAHHSSFNLIHLETGFKLDIFVLQTDQFNQSSFGRAVLLPISTSTPQQFRLHSPEDILLQKLNWYREGKQVSDRQWNDILGILKMQEQLDYHYLTQWAEQLGLSDLLTRAREQAGRSS